MSTVSFSQEVRSESWSGHQSSEGSSFLGDLMRGRGTLAGYIALTVQYHSIYSALEGPMSLRNVEVGTFADSALDRLPSLEADLRYLVGPQWREENQPLRSTLDYAQRINWAREHSSHAFIAHHYTRYLGDLSGGFYIGKAIARHLNLGSVGTSFYRFARISDPKAFKDEYRARLDSVKWTTEQRAEFIAEVQRAYAFNSRILSDLESLGLGAPA